MFEVVYSASKTALNPITLAFASDLDSTPIKVKAACPGFTATDPLSFFTCTEAFPIKLRI